MTDPREVDPKDYDENLLKQMGMPESTQPTGSLDVVFDRIVETTAAIDADPPGPQDVDLGDIETEAESPDGRVWVKLLDNSIASLRLDQEWVVQAPVSEVEDLVIDTVNTALVEAQERALQQLQSLETSIGPIMANLTQLQADVHRAYMNDLERVTAPLRNDS